MPLLPAAAGATGNGCTYLKPQFKPITCITVIGTGLYVKTVQGTYSGSPAGVSETGRFHFWGPDHYQYYTALATQRNLSGTVITGPVRIDRRFSPGEMYAAWQQRTATGWINYGPANLDIHP